VYVEVLSLNDRLCAKFFFDITQQQRSHISAP
jgi:hypothetical protein